MIKHAIVLVPFPFDDFTGTKVRPAVCLTSEIGDHAHVIIAFISSKIPENPLDSDIVIRINSAEAVGTGLVLDSVIKLHRMVTIPKSLIKRRLGHISAPIEVVISAKINTLFEKA